MGTFGLCAEVSAKTLRIKSLGEDELTATILQNNDDPLGAGQIVCILNKGQEINCGKIFRSNETEVVALFSEEGEKPVVGDEIVAKKQPGIALKKNQPSLRKPSSEATSSENATVDESEPPPTPLMESEPQTTFTEGEQEIPLENETVPNAKPKKPAPEMATTEEDAERQKLIKYHRSLIRKYYGAEDSFKKRQQKNANLSLGISLFGESTGNNLWPMGLLQFVTGKSSVFGLQGGYNTFGGNSVSGAGGYLLLNYHYYPYEPFLGPTARIGLGTGALTGTALTNNRLSIFATTPLVTVATTGYRWAIDRYFNVGVEAGVQLFYFNIPSNFNSSGSNISTTTSITFLMPLLLVDFGISF